MPIPNNSIPDSELDIIEKKLSDAAKGIEDQEFLRHPINKMKSILHEREEVQKQLHLKQDALTELHASLTQLQTKIKNNNNNVSVSNLKSQSDKIASEIEHQNIDIHKLTQTAEKLQNQFDAFNNNTNLVNYRNLFITRYKLKKKIATSPNINAIPNKNNKAPISLCENIFKIVEKKWFANFEHVHKFKLTTDLAKRSPGDSSPVEFSDKNGSKIIVTNDAVCYTHPLTTKNMRDIAPALIALFLKSIGESNLHGCDITDAPPEVIKYIEKMLATELNKRLQNSSNYMINGIPIDKILETHSTPPKPKPEPEQAIEPAQNPHLTN